MVCPTDRPHLSPARMMLPACQCASGSCSISSKAKPILLYPAHRCTIRNRPVHNAPGKPSCSILRTDAGFASALHTTHPPYSTPDTIPPHIKNPEHGPSGIHVPGCFYCPFHPAKAGRSSGGSSVRPASRSVGQSISRIAVSPNAPSYPLRRFISSTMTAAAITARPASANHSPTGDLSPVSGSFTFTIRPPLTPISIRWPSAA